MKYNLIIYRGELRSQFKTTEFTDIGTGKFNYASFSLEPRYRLFSSVKESEFVVELNEQNSIESYFNFPNDKLKHKQVGVLEIELYETNEPRNGKRILANEIHFYINIHETLESNSFVKGKVEWPELESKDQIQDKYYQTFLSIVEKIKAGKIVGDAYIIILETIKEAPIESVTKKEEPTNIEVKDPKPIVKTPPKGCLSIFFPFIPSRNSWFGKYLYLNKMPLNSEENQGCLPLFFPGGHWGYNLFRKIFPSFGLPSAGVPGCGSSGCGCMSLLFLLLIPFLLFKTCSHSNESVNTEQPVKIIHDTIVKEVIKEKVDTLFITKTDTVSLIDSTTVTTVEMVKLPNVQFYTDADVLLPSSAKELQKLAQYLTDNPKLKATIIGHTDNTGDPTQNLELSKRRAESVKNFLVQLGVKKNRLNSLGMGDKNPLGDNEKEEGRLMNRRVEVRLTQIGKIETKRSNKE